MTGSKGSDVSDLVSDCKGRKEGRKKGKEIQRVTGGNLEEGAGGGSRKFRLRNIAKLYRLLACSVPTVFLSFRL